MPEISIIFRLYLILEISSSRLAGVDQRRDRYVENVSYRSQPLTLRSEPHGLVAAQDSLRPSDLLFSCSGGTYSGGDSLPNQCPLKFREFGRMWRRNRAIALLS